jgi:hypothetical protein
MKNLKKVLITVGIVAVLYVVAIFTLEFFIEKNLKEQKELTYKEFEMTFGGNFSFKDLNFKNDTVQLQAGFVKLNIGLIKILTSKTILIDKATVKEAKLTFIKRDEDSLKVYPPKKKNERSFELRRVDISDFDFYSIENEDTIARVIGVDVKAKLKDLKDIQFNQLENLRVKYLQFNAGILIDIAVNNFEYKNQTATLDTFKVYTRYSKEEYIKHIPEQKGHIDLVAYKLVLDSLDFKTEKNKLLKITLNEINLAKFELDVYRDKTIAEYTQHEQTYAEVFQSLDFEIVAKAMITKNSRISFAMKTDDGRVSTIYLNDINAKLTHINNVPSMNEIINLTGSLSVSPKSVIGVYLSYNQHANVETFQLDIHGRNIETAAMNTMFRPALNAELSGIVDKLDAKMISNGSGNGTVRLQSENLQVQLFTQDGKERKLLTAVGNIIVNKSLDKTGIVEEFEFDQTRPMWNYIWHFIQEGLKKAVI